MNSPLEPPEPPEPEPEPEPELELELPELELELPPMEDWFWPPVPADDCALPLLPMED